MAGKFQIPKKTSAEAAPASVDEFVGSAAMGSTAPPTSGESTRPWREPKPVRINFDLDVETHFRLRQYAKAHRTGVATLLRDLIKKELGI